MSVRTNRKQTPDEMRQRCYDAHDGLYSYEEADFQGSKQKVKIRCPIHGLFEQQVIEHYKGRGCAKCQHTHSAIRQFCKKTKGARTRDIIGLRYGEFEQLEVVKLVQQGIKSRDDMFSVKCHKCAEDAELFGDATFIVSRSNIYGRGTPCGCVWNYIYDEQQMKVVGTRHCAGRTFSLINTLYKGADTVFTFQCDIDGHTWDKLYKLLYQDTGCWKCGRVSTGIAHLTDEQEQANKFLSSGKYEVSTKLRRDVENVRIWYFTCPVCSENGKEFKTHDSTLRRGYKPCYCGERSGYDKNKCGHFYVFRAVSNTSEFTGYGITNTPKKRIATHKCELAKKGFAMTELEIFEMNGKLALYIENFVKANFPLFSQEIEGFRSEATYYYLYDELLECVDNMSNSPHLSQSLGLSLP